MDSVNLTLFLASVALLALLPGPDNMYVMALAAKEGFKSALLLILGLMTGLVVHTALYALGITAILLANEKLFLAIKLTGALYLLYLAYQLYTSVGADSSITVKHQSSWRYYLRGIIMNLSNIKVLLFFMAFFIQFLTPQSQRLDILLLGALFIIVAFVVFTLLALFSAVVHQQLLQRKSFINIGHLLSKVVAIFLLFISLELFVDIMQ